MVNELLGFITGGYSHSGYYDGFMVRTTDGEHWNPLSSPSEYPLNKTYFNANGKGFLLGQNGDFFCSTDAGDHWWTLIGLGGSYGFSDITFTDDFTGFILGYENGHAIILKTNDGGWLWEKVFVDTEPAALWWAGSISFIDNSTGYAIGRSGHFAKTNDGGKSWIAQDRFTGNDLHAILPMSDSSGYLVGEFGTFVSFGKINPEGTGNDPYVENYIATYPNPFSETVLFELYSNVDDLISIELFDLNGKLVGQGMRNIYKGKQTFSFRPAVSLKNGTYMYKLRGKEIFNKGKIIMMR
jgi:hypothetical protein